MCSTIIQHAFVVPKSATFSTPASFTLKTAKNVDNETKSAYPGHSDACGKESSSTKRESEITACDITSDKCVTSATVYFVGDLKDLNKVYLRLKLVQQSKTRVLDAEEATISEQHASVDHPVYGNRKSIMGTSMDSGSVSHISGGTSSTTDDFVFPLVVNDKALVPLAVGLYSFGKGPRGPGLLAVALCDEVYVIDLVARHPTYQARLFELVDWLFTNPFVSKVVYRADHELQSIAFAVDKCGRLGNVKHCIDVG